MCWLTFQKISLCSIIRSMGEGESGVESRPLEDTKVIREVLTGFRDFVIEQGKKPGVGGLRMILAGSEVGVPKVPDDLDILILHEEEGDYPPSEKYEVPTAKGKVSVDVINMSVAEFKKQLFNVVSEGSVEKDPVEGNRKILANRFVLDTMVIFAGEHEMTEDQFRFAYWLPVLIDIARGKMGSFSELLAKSNFKVRKDDPDFMTKIERIVFDDLVVRCPEMEEKLRDLQEVINESGEDRVEAMLRLNEIVDGFAGTLGKGKAGKMVRVFTNAYVHGFNFVQMVKIGGIRVLYGENIPITGEETQDPPISGYLFSNEEMDGNYLPPYKEDKGFNRSSLIRRIQGRPIGWIGKHVKI
jgi:hypothetical protein